MRKSRVMRLSEFRAYVSASFLLFAFLYPGTVNAGTGNPSARNRNYYFSSKGSDNNDGRTPQTAWRTMDPAKWQMALPGDSILFEKGSSFFGTIIMRSSGTAGQPIVFSAYGTGPKPVLTGAENIRNYIHYWKKSEKKQNVYIYKGNHTEVDVANLVLEAMNGQVSFGRKIMSPSPEFSRQGDFWYDYDQRQFEFYSESSPQEMYRSIQLVKNINALDITQEGQSAEYLVFDNLDFRYFGRNVLESGGTHCTFRDLDISFIGGGDRFSSPVERRYQGRWGNAIQVGQGVHDLKVSGCRVDQVYGSAISVLGDVDSHASGSGVFNIDIRNNVISHSASSFELSDWGGPGHPRLRDVFFENNTCTDAGKAWWHNQRWDVLHLDSNISGPDPYACHIRLARLHGIEGPIFIRRNIFYGSTGAFFLFSDTTAAAAVDSDHNVFFDSVLRPLGILYRTRYDTSPVNISALEIWRQHTGNDDSSLFVDPMFMSAEDVRLSPCSPLIGKRAGPGFDGYVGAFPPQPDREPPTIRFRMVTPPVLWPANHKMIDVFLDYQTRDNCGTVTESLKIETNEPVSGLSGGDKYPDWIVVDARHVQLRAERAPNMNGRVYTISIRASDAAGNIAERYVQVTVPRRVQGEVRTEGWYDAEKEPTNEGGDLACRVFPNPSSNYFDIAITSTESKDVIQVNILDVNGKPMDVQKLWHEKTVRVGQDLPRGIYYAEVRQGDQMLRVQLTKQ